MICEVCHGSLISFVGFITMSSVVEEKIKEYCEAEGINNTVPIKLNSVLQFTSGNTRKENDNELDAFKMEEVTSLKSENETMNIQGGICALCLKKRDDFKAIDGNIKNFLDMLLSKINFTVIQGSVMCKKCEEMLIKYLDFKAVCLHTQVYIVSFLSDRDNVQLNLKDLYLNKNVTGFDVLEDQDVCRFCMGLVKSFSAIFLGVEERGVMLDEMIEQCLPELDLSVIKKSVICPSCYGTLEDCFNFVKKCLVIREKTKEYCKTPDMNSKGQIEVSSSLTFTIRDETTGETDDNSGDIIKVEEDRKSPHEREIGDKLDFVKTEETFCEENETKHEDLIEMKDQQFLFKEEIEIKTEEPDFNRFEDGITLPQSEVIRMYQCDTCSFQTKFKTGLIRHLLKHKDPSEVTMYKCDSCSFQTKYRGFLKSHLLKHKDPSMYICDFCSYQTTRKFNFKNHLLTHKDPSELTVYKCNYCLFQTKHKNGIKKHLIVHKNPSEVTMYTCDSCSFQTKYKRYLKIHLLKHKDPSEVTMYRCDSCLYQTKRKHSLEIHLLVHKDPSEVTMYKCSSCSFQTKYKDCIKSHLLKHKDPSEVTMFKCDFCSYYATRKSNLKNHLLAHKDPSEVIMYKCDCCLFQSRHKSDLKKHLIVHKTPSEVTMYKCDSCLYQAKRKRDLKNHLVVHKNPSEVTMYKCDSCSYQTKYKRCLKVHLLKHKDHSEVTM